MVDPQTEKMKGYGTFSFVDEADIEMCLRCLNGFSCGPNSLVVQVLGSAARQIGAKAQPLSASAMPNSINQKIMKNPDLARMVRHGSELGLQPSKVVQLLNAL